MLAITSNITGQITEVDSLIWPWDRYDNIGRCVVDGDVALFDLDDCGVVFS